MHDLVDIEDNLTENIALRQLILLIFCKSNHKLSDKPWPVAVCTYKAYLLR